MSKIDTSKSVFRVTFVRADGRRETEFFNADDLADAEKRAAELSNGQPSDAPYEIDPKTGHRVEPKGDAP